MSRTRSTKTPRTTRGTGGSVDWEGIARAYYDTERRRLGLPTRVEEEALRVKREQEAAAAASDLESQSVGREFTRAKLAALPEEQRLQRENLTALADYRRAMAERQPQPRAPHYVTDARGNVRAITPSETGFDIRDLGGIGTPQRETGGAGGLSPASESNIINRLSTQWDKANATGR